MRKFSLFPVMALFAVLVFAAVADARPRLFHRLFHRHAVASCSTGSVQAHSVTLGGGSCAGGQCFKR